MKTTFPPAHCSLASKLLFLLLLSSLNSFAFAQSKSVYDTFLQCLKDQTNQTDHQISTIVYSPTNTSYTSVLDAYIRNGRFNRSNTPKPAIIVTPLTVSHVQATVVCAKDVRLQLKIRSGGHDFEGLSYVSDYETFIILDMFNLRSIDVNVKDETVWVQAGAILGELYYRIWEKTKVHGFPAGACPTVGVGGHISEAGYGNMLRKYGLTVDNVLDAAIVDANGRLLDRESMGEDFFWAINGGGGASFGVVISYKIKLVPVPEVVTVFRVQKTLEENATEIVNRWQYVADKVDNDLFIRLLLQPVIVNGIAKTVRASFVCMFLGDANRLMSVMDKGFPELGLRKEDCKEMSWIGSVLYWASFNNNTSIGILLKRPSGSANLAKRKSDYTQKPIPKEGLEWILKKMIQLGKTELVFNPYGGRMSEISEGETPFPHRAGNIFKLQYSVNWKEEGIDVENMYLNQIRRLYTYMTPFVSKAPRGAYMNYRDLDIGINDNGKNAYDEGKVYGEKYFMCNFDRLVKVKTMFDPHNFFRNEQSIPPLSSSKN